MIAGLVFVVVAAVLCVVTVLAVFGVLHLYMSGGDAIQRDGLRRGTRAPSWSLPDLSGAPHVSPPKEEQLQLVMFTDHSLKSFPSVVDDLQRLAKDPDLDIVVLLQGLRPLAASILELLGIGSIPIVVGSPRLYGRYNVRVTPFVIFVDHDGRVRASSLVNHDWQLVKLARLARVPLEAAAPRRQHGVGRFARAEG